MIAFMRGIRIPVGTVAIPAELDIGGPGDADVPGTRLGRLDRQHAAGEVDLGLLGNLHVRVVVIGSRVLNLDVSCLALSAFVGRGW